MRLLILILSSALFFPYFGYAQVSPPANLKSAIDAKTEELKQIHQQLQETQSNLIEAGQKKQSLQREISNFNYRISQLNLSIRSNEITIDKLGLEIKSLEYSIGDIEEKISQSEETLHKLLRELQIKGDEELVVILLKGQSLADSLAEVNDLAEIRKALGTAVDDLREFKNNLNDQLDQVSQKREAIQQEHRAAQARKNIAEEQRTDRKELLALTKNQEEIYQKLIDELAERQTAIAEEIEALERNLRAQIDPTLLPPQRPGVLGWPIDDGYRRITQKYGATAFARYGYKGQWHNGIDLGSPIGTPVLAAEDGVVTNTGDQDQFCRKGAYGRFIIVHHSNNLTTLYAHLSQIAVSPGSQVKRGEIIGYVGSTGYSTGSHLHFTVYDGNTFKMTTSRTCGLMPSGGDINPEVYL